MVLGFFFSPCPWHMEVPGPEVEPAPQRDNGGSLTARPPGNSENMGFFVFCLFRAAPAAYRSSQARG